MRSSKSLARLPGQFPAAMLGRIQANGQPPGWPNRVPRGLVSANPMAQAQKSPADFMAEITTSLDQFQERHRGDLKAMQEGYDEMQRKLTAIGIGGSVVAPDRADDPLYTAQFRDYFRHGGQEEDLRRANATGDRASIMAAMSSGNDQSGGFLAPTEWDRQVNTALRNVSPLRRLCDVKNTKTRGYSTVYSDGLLGSGWVGEVASRPQTTTPNLAQLVFTVGEIYACPAISQQLLDDADFNIAEWLASELAAVFGMQEGVSFVAGDGLNKPTGFLTHVAGFANATKHPGGPIPTVVTGNANAITADSLVDVVFDLGAPYRQGAAWLMSSVTANFISKMKDGQGNYLWRTSLVAGQPSTLLGYEVAIDENMPAPVAGNIPVAFGNWQLGYVINDRAGLRTLRDPFSAKPYVLLYSTKRVGGGVKDPRALRVLKVAAAS